MGWLQLQREVGWRFISVAQTSARLRHLVAGEVNLCKSDLLGPLLRY